MRGKLKCYVKKSFNRMRDWQRAFSVNLYSPSDPYSRVCNNEYAYI